MTQATPSSKSSTSHKSRAPVAMTIAGSDSGGGAGIQADLKTFSALGVYGASTITALTAQNTQTVQGIHDVPPEFVVNQLETVLADIQVDAIKIGMLSSVPIIQAVSSVLGKYSEIPIVLDPVMVAKSGDRLLGQDAHEAVVEQLFPLARLLTPNVPEAAILTGKDSAESEAEMIAQATVLSKLGSNAVLMKGGHLSGEICEDVLFIDGDIHRYSHPRVHTGNTHGTGCTLSSAITAYLAKGCELPDAVQQASDYLHQAILAADSLNVGQGHGPVHHFHKQW
ncbi:MAG: bifunctional hydroxymethylpyrimidine kinase/phosphomethylpyrimidine kinase [Granulosicoccus sp.]